MHKIKELLHKDSDKASTHSDKHVEHQHVTTEKHAYVAGQDPALSRDTSAVLQHDGGVTRESVDEHAVVKEQIREVELHKVQPVIHRDREQKEIRHVVQPHRQVEVRDTEITHKEKNIDLGTRHEGASTLETTRASGQPHIESTREVVAGERRHQELPAQVEEHVHRKVEEHIHPVIYKETLKPKVIEEVQHVYETVKEKPVETFEVRDSVHRGATTTLPAEQAFFAQNLGTHHVATPSATSSAHMARTTTTTETKPVHVLEHKHKEEHTGHKHKVEDKVTTTGNTHSVV